MYQTKRSSRLKSQVFSIGIQRPRTRALVINAIQSVAELLEPRRLLSISPSALQSSVPSGVDATLTSAGTADLSIAADSNGIGQSTPDYVEMDADPQISAQGTLEPFSTAAPTGYLPAVARHAYGVDQIMFGSITGDGTGQTIAIVDAYDYPTATADLHAFDLAAGLPDPPSLTRVNETGGSTLPGDDPAGKGDDWEVEEALDVEWSHAMAPGANIVLVEASSTSDADLIDAAVGYARSAPGVVAVTMSFGRAENSTDTSLDSLFTTPVGHAGVTFLASTGDNAAPGGYPSFSPNVVAVGGTTLTANSSGGYISETGWTDSGGGISTYETQPAFQKGVVTQSTTARTIPDIASDADPNTGVAIYDSYDFGTADPWLDVGGTSVSSPSWAGLIAIADQGRTLGGGGSLDGSTQTLPKLYSMAASNFHDITSGNNGFAAGPGYDLVTGRGSPVANTLIPLLAAAGPFVTTATPTGIQTTAPSSFVFNFSGAMNTSSFSVANGVDSFTGPGSVNLISSITGFAWSNSNTTLTVNFTAPTAQGAYTMVIGPNILSTGGVAMDQNQDGVPGEIPGDEYADKFNFDSNPLTVASTNPSAGGVLTAPSATLSVTFNQAINPATAAISNLNVSQGTVSAVSVLAGNTTVQYTISGLTSDGNLTATIAAGALNDANGNPLYQGYSGSYIVDVPSAALPVPFVSALPAGSLIYTAPVVNDAIQFAGDTHSYTVSLNANQTLTVTVAGATGLVPTVQVTSPTAVVLGTATGTGSSVVLETLPVTTAGVYTITVTGSNNSKGTYALGATLNAAVNPDNFTGATNHTLGSAQDLTSSFISLGGGATRGAVTGGPVSGSTSLNDYYSYPLNAGDSITLGLKASVAQTDNLSLLNSSGGVLASGITGATNVDQAIANFITPNSGTYYVLVSATSGATSYDLFAVKNAVFSLQPHNSFATAQSLGGTQAALGDLGGASGGNSVTLTAVAQGWWDATGLHTLGNSNYEAGGDTSSVEHRNYFVFNLSGITYSIASAQLSVPNPTNGYLSNKASDTYALFDVSTSISALEAGNSGQTSIFTDLGTGASYGTTTVSSASNGNSVGVTLDSAAIAALNQGLGSQFAIGGALTTYTSGVNDYLFGYSGTSSGQLIVTPGGGADWYSVNVTNTSNFLAFSTSSPGGAGGQFADTADPHLEIFDPNDNLVATGTKLADGRNESISYQPLMTGTYRIEVLPQNNSSGEYVLQAGNALQLGLPANVTQGQGVVTGTLNASNAPTSNLTVTLISSDPSRLTVPSTIVLPAGQTSIALPITAVTNNLLEGPEAITITAAGGTYFSATAVVTIHDTQTAVLSLSLPATAYKNGGTVTGTITCSAAPAQNVTIALSSSLTTSLTVPATVTLLAGQTTATFTATVVNNTVLTGNVLVNVAASVENWTTGTASINILETNNNISLALPLSGWEGQTLTNASVNLGGTVTSPLVISLTSSDPAELSVPATVTIPTGSSYVYFNVTLINDGIKFGSRNLTVSAAGTGLNSPGPTSMVVYDSNLDHLGFSAITGPKTAGTSSTATVDAYNVANLIIPVYYGVGNVTAAGQAGVVPVSPSSASFSAGIWTGQLTLTLADPATSLTVTSGGLVVTSNKFVVQPGAESNLSWGAVTTPQIANVPFSETITATDAYGNPATTFNGSVTLSGLVGSTISTNMLGTGGSYPYATSNTYTWGYSFVPNTSFQVTAVRSYFGNSISIWNSSETLLATQAITATAGSWTLTSLSTPLQLTAGTTYYVGDYTTSTYYYGYTAPPNPSFATIGSSYYYAGANNFPIYSDSGIYFPVDLQGNVGAFVTVPITPTTATFVNGVWTGNIDVTQGATNIHLHAVDASSHTADSNNFTVIVQTLSLNLPSDAEETDGTDYGVLQVSPAPTTNVTVNLNSSDSTRLTVPSSIVIPAGQTSVTVPLTLIQTNSLDGLDAVTITATAYSYATAASIVKVHSSQTATLSVSLASSVTKGGSITGTITASAAPTQNITINLASSNSKQATVPATITLLAGQTTATFVLSAVQDTVIDGTQLVTVSAAVDDWTTGYKSIAILDDNNYVIVVLPTGGFEGQTFTNGGTVSVGGTLTTALTVNLSSNDPSQISIPSSVTIPAGASSATFNIVLVNNGIKGLSQTAVITPSASGMIATAGSMIVHDANLDHLVFSTTAASHTVATPFSVTITAYNLANEVIADYTGTAALTAAGHVGAISVTPVTAAFSAGTWTGNVTIPVIDPSVTLTATAGSISASSNAFATQAGSVASFGWSSIASTQTVNSPIPVTISALDANGFPANSFNGSATLSGLVGSSLTNQDMIGSPTYGASGNNGTYTVGYAFTPTVNITVTGVRSYFGSKVDIWTNTGTLLATQAVSGVATVWTETPLTTPVQLTAGTTYRLTVDTGGQTYYWRTTATANPSFATLGQTYEISGDAFPTNTDNQYWQVDLRATIGSQVTVPITPTTATFTNGVWTGNISVQQSAALAHLHVDDGLGQTGDSGAFNVNPAAVAAPVLAAASDTGVSNSDSVTNLNNSAGKTLSFSVGNTIAGATITLYANETAIGTAVATGTSTIVTTNGTTVLADGIVSFTARQTIGSVQSVDSISDAVTIITTPPTATLAAVTPVQSVPVNSDSLTFSKPIAGLTLADLSLTLNGGANLLTGSETLTSTDNQNWNISNLAQFTVAPGSYILSLSPAGITDIAGNLLVAGSNASWTVTSSALTLSSPASNTGYYLRLDPSDANLQVWQTNQPNLSTAPGSPPTFTYPLGSFGNIIISGSAAQNFSVTVDESNGMITTGGISFSGGAAGDSLVVVLPASGSTTSVSATTLSPSANPASAITYSQLSSITIDGSAGNDTLIQTGQPAAPLTFNGGTGNDTLTVNAGTFTFSGNPELLTASLTLNDNSQVDFTAAAAGTGIQVIDLASLNIGATGVAQFADALSHADRSLLVTSGLSIVPTGKLDLGFNDAIIKGGSLTAVNSQLSSGFNNGNWQGAGIESSAASTNPTHLTALGAILNNDGKGDSLYGTGALGLFDGQSPSINDVLIKYTYYGDTNLDGHVDGGDYSRIDNAYLEHLTGWFNGDFNYDSTVDGSDYTLIDNAFNTQGATLSAQVATPTAGPTTALASSVQTRKRVSTGASSTPSNATVFSSSTPIAPSADPSSIIDLLTRQKDVLDRLTD